MNDAQGAVGAPSTDPAQWVDQHGDYLFRYAVFRLRDTSLAEDILQEALLAALQSYHNFEGRGSERTWLVGILKHKVMDHYRRTGRETPESQFESDTFEHEELFRESGKWEGHWIADKAPTEWNDNPAELAEQSEFWVVFQNCLSPLPPRTANAFTLREVDGLTSEEICEVLNIRVNNLWVMLHRARLHLRQCLEANWFRNQQRRR
ncbi:MAG: sigma-70 family RNA polymerase sigma factor [Acidobacteriota bacterium]|nr:sigma-70 family RNA polymerase sigma factor [Acidobacteriota bacterium]